jgi:hypothetical protein
LSAPDQRPVLSSIIDAYRHEGIRGTIAAKAMKVRVLFGDPSLIGPQHVDPTHTGMGWIRQLQMRSVFIAPGVTLMGLPCLLLKKVRSASWVRPVFAVTGVSAIVFVLIEFGGNVASWAWLHVAPFTMLLLWVATGGLALVTASHRLLAVVMTVQGAFFITVWVAPVTVASATSVVPAGHPNASLRAIAAGVGVGFIGLSLIALARDERQKARLVTSTPEGP